MDKKPLIVRKKITLIPKQNWKPITDASQIPTTGQTVIAFDVAILTMAYCILHVDNNKWTILDWQVFSLLDGNKKLKCSQCGAAAIYKEGSTGYCRRHRTETATRNYTVDNSSQMEIRELLFRKLDSNPIFLLPQVVLIEYQPNKATEKVKGLRHTLFDYYVLRGIVDKGHSYNAIQFADAKNKLRVYYGPTLNCHLKNQYDRNKWYAKEYCKWWLEQDGNSSLLAHYNSHSKKDDLADAFLHAMWFFHKELEAKYSVGATNKTVLYHNYADKYRTVRAKAPKPKGRNYTLANLKYITIKTQDPSTINDHRYTSAVNYFFGGLDAFMTVLKNM